MKYEVDLPVWPPNTRVQRTRSSPSAPHSPLTRYPLGTAKREAGDRVGEP